MIEFTLIQAVLAAAGCTMIGMLIMAIILGMFSNLYDKKQNQYW